VDQGAITLDLFTADPDTITPCGGPSSTLSWRISTHEHQATTDAQRRALSRVTYTLGFFSSGEVVAAAGSKTVHPSLTWTYTISAVLGRASQPLGDVVVSTDQSSCSTTPIIADQLRQLAQVGAEQFVRQQGARLRSPVALDITENGIHIHLAITRPGKIDVDVDVDAVFQLFPTDCTIRLTYARYNVDADLPWWLYLIDPLIVGTIEAFLSVIIGNELRAALLTQFQQQLAAFIPASQCVCYITLGNGQFSVLTCPR
jgi:hypothetical protein